MGPVEPAPNGLLAYDLHGAPADHVTDEVVVVFIGLGEVLRQRLAKIGVGSALRAQAILNLGPSFNGVRYAGVVFRTGDQCVLDFTFRFADFVPKGFDAKGFDFHCGT